MGAPTETPSTADAWHMNLDDLFAPLPEKPRLGGAGPFVINLTSSPLPIGAPARGLVSIPGAYVYQIQRMEDRSVRHRLRLGPFILEDDADSSIGKVREVYPGALTATAGADDLNAIAEIRTVIDTSKPAVLSSADPVADVTLSVAEVSRAIEQLSRPLEPLSRRAAVVETTRTVRALTPVELNEDEVPRWFAVQLSSSDRAVDPDTVPNLDIFGVYRLYAVEAFDQGRALHALRLGFFAEEVAANAVASYLAAHYDKPTVRRVSAAERERFSKERVEARKDVGLTGRHAVIEITNERYIRAARVPRAEESTLRS